MKFENGPVVKSGYVKPLLATAALSLFFSGCASESAPVLTADVEQSAENPELDSPESSVTDRVTTASTATTLVNTTSESLHSSTTNTKQIESSSTTVAQTTLTTSPPEVTPTSNIPETTEAEPQFPNLHFLGEFECGVETWAVKYDDNGDSYAVAPDGTVFPLLDRGFTTRDLEFFENLKNVEDPRFVHNVEAEICSGD